MTLRPEEMHSALARAVEAVRKAVPEAAGVTVQLFFEESAVHAKAKLNVQTSVALGAKGATVKDFEGRMHQVELYQAMLFNASEALRQFCVATLGEAAGVREGSVH